MTRNKRKKFEWEGWTAQDFIDELEPIVDLIMEGRGITKPFKDRASLEKWCLSNQPYYKKRIPEVIDYFAEKYNLR